jgi:hypothetical protein
MGVTVQKAFLCWTLVALALAGTAAHAADYDPAHCQAVAGTLNIFWDDVTSGTSSCTGIEYTDGSLAQAATGSITMTGTSVSNPSCIGTAAYAFTQSGDRMLLAGSDTQDDVPMTLTLSPDHACYVGHWIRGGADFVATISAAPFPQVIVPTPMLDPRNLVLLAGLLALLGCLRKASR